MTLHGCQILMVVVNARKFASERLHLFSFIIPFRLNNSAYNVWIISLIFSVGGDQASE